MTPTLAFSIGREALAAELAVIIKTVEGKSTIPILQHFMLEGLDDGRLKVTGTDLEIGLVSFLRPMKVGAAGAVTLPAKTLLDTVRKLSGKILTMIVDETHKATIVCDKAVVKITGMPRESFPELPVSADPVNVILKTDVFAEMLRRTRWAISAEESRFTLNGALLESNGNTRLTSTDGHRLATADVPQKARHDFRAIVPTKALGMLDIMTRTRQPKDLLVTCQPNGEHMFFCIDDRVLLARKLTGNFPDYERVLPKKNAHVAMIDRELAETVLKRAVTFADERSRCVQFHVKPDHIMLVARTVDGADYSEPLPAVYRGPEIEVGYNGDYVIQYLHSETSEHVNLCLENAQNSAMLQPVEPLEGGMGYTYVLMPMRI